MEKYRAIACHKYDYIELACIRCYPLTIEIKHEGICHGKALTTETRADKSEWLVIETVSLRRSIRLDQIIAITPKVEGAEFGRIEMAG